MRNGEKVGSIFFSPTDISIIKRLREVKEKLSQIEVKPDIEKDIDAAIAEADRVDKMLREYVDYAFDYPCSDIVFGSGYSFSSFKGTSALEQFLNAAMEIVSKEMKTEAEAAQKRQAKYLDKYKK